MKFVYTTILLLACSCASSVPHEEMDLCSRICAGKPALVENDRGTIKCRCREI